MEKNLDKKANNGTDQGMLYLGIAYLLYFLLKFPGYTTLSINIPSLFLRLAVLIFLLIAFLRENQVSLHYKLYFLLTISFFCFIIIRSKLLNSSSMLDSDFVFFLLFLMTCNSYKRIMKLVQLSFWSKSFGMLVLLFMIFMNKITNIVTINSDLSIRNSWGFQSPNGLGCTIAFICIDYIFLNRKKRGLLVRLMLTLGLNYIFYTQSKSRTAFISYLIFSLLILFFNFKKNKITFLNRYLLNGLTWLLPLIATTFPYFYTGKGIWKEINHLLSDRLIMGHQYYMEFGLHLFGSLPLKQIPYNWGNWTQIFLLDSSYVRFLLEFGILAFIFIIIYIFVVINRILKSDDPMLFTFIFVGLLYGVTERLSYHVDLFPLILLCNIYLFKKDRNH